ncbi:MAG: tetratricopeptide repeat protein [bacterium]|nr:tetratricopeptide repeat protein [bacterium]
MQISQKRPVRAGLRVGALLGVLGFAACSDAVGPVLPTDPEGLEEEVRALVDEHLELVRKNPSDGAAHGELGLVYEGNKLWAEAADSYALAEELDPGDPLWTYHRAIAVREGGQTAAALALLHGAVALQQNAAAQFRLGSWLLEAGNLDGAEGAFDRARLLVPQQPEPLVGLAEVHVARENFASARVFLEQAIEMDYDYRQAHYQLGLAYRGLGRMDDAQRELALGQNVDRRGFDKRFLRDAYAIRAEKHSYSYADRMAHATSLIQSGNNATAVEILEKLRADQPDDTNVLNNLASAYIEMGSFDRAVVHLKHILELDSSEFAAHLNLGYAYLGRKQLDLALSHADRAASLAPEVGRVHLVRARVLVAMGAFPEARAALETSIRYDSREPRSLVTLGQICLQLEDLAAVIEHMTNAITLVPDSADAHIALFEAYVRVGRIDLAEKTLTKLAEIAPNEPRLPNARRFLERSR